MLLSTNSKILIARSLKSVLLFFRHLAGLDDETVVKRGGIRWRLDLNEGIDLAIYLFGSFEPSTLAAYRRLLKEGDTVLDIGANIGAHTLPMAKLVGEVGHVYAFEPTVYAYNKLVENIALNPELEGRITPLQIMLSDGVNTSLVSEIYSSWPLGKKKNLHPVHAGRLQSTDGAAVSSGDEYVKTGNISRVDFIKLDVDGNEVSVLLGSESILQRDHCPLLMELSFYTLEEANKSVDDLLDILERNNYQIYDESSGQSLPMNVRQLRSLVPEKGSRNILARVIQD